MVQLDESIVYCSVGETHDSTLVAILNDSTRLESLNPNDSTRDSDGETRTRVMT